MVRVSCFSGRKFLKLLNKDSCMLRKGIAGCACDLISYTWKSSILGSILFKGSLHSIPLTTEVRVILMVKVQCKLNNSNKLQ